MLSLFVSNVLIFHSVIQVPNNNDDDDNDSNNKIMQVDPQAKTDSRSRLHEEI